MMHIPNYSKGHDKGMDNASIKFQNMAHSVGCAENLVANEMIKREEKHMPQCSLQCAADDGVDDTSKGVIVFPWRGFEIWDNLF